MKTAICFLLCALFTVFSKANPTPEPCIDALGQPATEWSLCSSSPCCVVQCSCLEIYGVRQAVCRQACPYFMPLPGCTFLEPIHNATHMDCCRIECTVPQLEEPLRL